MAKKTKMPTDLNQRGKAIVYFATSDEEPPAKDAARAAGGAKGGASRAAKLTSEQRSEIPRRAARDQPALHALQLLSTPLAPDQEGRESDDPAMAAGVARSPWSLTQMAELLD
jgi:hypothetical protein